MANQQGFSSIGVLCPPSVELLWDGLLFASALSIIGAIMDNHDHVTQSTESDEASLVEVLDVLRRLQNQSTQMPQQAPSLPLYTTKLTSTTSVLPFSRP